MGCMSALTEGEIARLLDPYLQGGLDGGAVERALYTKLSVYLDLLLLWNGRTNLTALRDPAEIVTRHFGESLLLSRLVPEGARRVLDLGSGAGFPGIPLQLLHPALTVTLAESQGKKASFLREAVRVLGLRAAVHADRVEKLPLGTRFDAVALRAVDDMSLAMRLAVGHSDRLLLLTTRDDDTLRGLEVLGELGIPGSRQGIAALCVPRGTLVL